jgi:hypothetical protein
VPLQERLLRGGRGSAHGMTSMKKTRAIFTDIHFLIPLAAFCLGLALLILIH